MRRLVEMLCTAWALKPLRTPTTRQRMLAAAEVGDAGPKVVKQKDGMDKNAADRLLWQPPAQCA